MMAIAAVPDYLGKDFSTASPGMRFGMYFQGWTQSWQKHVPEQKNNEKPAIKSACRLTNQDKAAMAYLLQRQQASFKAASSDTNGLQLEAISISPFSTGLGNEHPTENGFAFLNPYGLPYLPGSGIKGVLRQAARELASGEWGDRCGWDKDKYQKISANEESWVCPVIDILFGKEDSNDAQRGALMFWDVIPQLKGESLSVDIMTPHQKHYYQAGQSPHDSGQPNPITFLAVPPGSGFTFHVQCNLALLQRTAKEQPELLQQGCWQTLLKAAFEHAFNWLGFGAKTAVGYGAMEEDQKKKAEREEKEKEQQEAEQKKLEQQQRQQEIANMGPVEKAIAECLDARVDQNQPEINALLASLEKDNWNDEVAIGVAQNLKEKMQADKKWREESAAKNPKKDKNHQNTLRVMKYLKGE